MSDFYDDMALTADEMLTEDGQTVTITTQGAGTYNPATGATTTPAPTVETGSGVEVAYRASQIDGTLIKAGDKSFLLSPFTTAGASVTKPVADVSTLTLADGSIWTVKAVEPLSPAGTPVLFTLQLRGAP